MIKKSAGFTLVEVLVALVVLSGGLLGLAALQATSLKNNQIAYNRNQATQLAYDIIDRMRANGAPGANASLLSTSTYVTVAPNAATPQTDCETVSATCTTADMAQNDLFRWNAAIVATLPNGTGNITVDAAAQIFTITISWAENIDKNNDGTIDNNDRVIFQTNFQL